MGAPGFRHTPAPCHSPRVSHYVRGLGPTVWVGFLCSGSSSISSSSGVDQCPVSWRMLAPAQPPLSSPYLLPSSAYRKHRKVAAVSPTDWAELSQLANEPVFSPQGADSKADSLSYPPDISITHLVLTPQRRPSRGHGGER